MSNFIISQLVLGEPGPVNLDEVVTFEKFDHIQTREDEGRYQIMFLRNEASVGPKQIFWKYAKKCDRNSEYDKLITKHSQTL